MIYGVGIDTIEVKRVENAIIKNNSFLNKVFSESEIAKCANTANQFQSYAARFAAKEAFMKALGTGWSQGIKWSEITISNNNSGKPIIQLSGKTKSIVDENGISKIHLSLTHVSEYASAVVIMETI